MRCHVIWESAMMFLFLPLHLGGVEDQWPSELQMISGDPISWYPSIHENRVFCPTLFPSLLMISCFWYVRWSSSSLTSFCPASLLTVGHRISSSAVGMVSGKNHEMKKKGRMSGNKKRQREQKKAIKWRKGIKYKWKNFTRGEGFQEGKHIRTFPGEELKDFILPFLLHHVMMTISTLILFFIIYHILFLLKDFCFILEFLFLLLRVERILHVLSRSCSTPSNNNIGVTMLLLIFSWWKREIKGRKHRNETRQQQEEWRIREEEWWWWRWRRYPPKGSLSSQNGIKWETEKEMMMSCRIIIKLLLIPFFSVPPSSFRTTGKK